MENRLNEIFGLKTEDKNLERSVSQIPGNSKISQNLDYKFAVKFLDNGKSLEENYQEALKKGLKQIVKLLIDNKVVKHLEIENINNFFEEREFTVGLYDLSKYKYDLYQIFIEKVFQKFIKEDYYNESENSIEMKLNDFDKIIYTKDTLLVKLPMISFNSEDNGLLGVTDYKRFTLYSLNGFTAGEILYKIAQKIPNAKDLVKFTELIIKNNDPSKILRELENMKLEIQNSIIFNDELKDIRFIDEYFIEELNTLINNYDLENDQDEEGVLSNWRSQINELIEWFSDTGRPTEPYAMYDMLLQEKLSYDGIGRDASPIFMDAL